jgi:hypothetical protein
LNRATITSALLALAAALCAAATAAGPAWAAAGPSVAADLLGVSCATARDCLAVGVGGNAFPLAETWNGTAWRTVSVRLPPGATAGGLRGVSCAAAARCVSVGYYDEGPGQQFALAEAWNGAAWAPARPPAPGTPYTALYGVSCTSAARCVAVGQYQMPDQVSGPLAEIWNGKRWTQASPPASGPGFAISGLNGVSCTSRTSCVAVGTPLGTRSVPVIERWNGKSWSAAQGAAVPGDVEAVLTGVSCRSARSCVAVGFGTRSAAPVSISEIWSGQSWRYAAVPLPGGGTSGSLLEGVSCAAGRRCVAVGDTASPGTQRAAAVTWNGRAWTVTSVPAPGRGNASRFDGVTCLPAAHCVAAGQAGPLGSVDSTVLTGFWNGRCWRLVTAPSGRPAI